MKLTQLQKVLWTLAGAGVIASGSLSLWVDYRGYSTRQVQEPAFGADFELTDHQGTVRTDDDFAGQWLLVFFGFTNCPDICPMTLAEIAAVMDGLGENASRIQPLFITIDPERDTPEALADFVPRFDAGIIGLTGTPEQIGQTADSFHIYYDKIEEAAAPDGYTMGHSSQLFLFDQSGGYAASWQYGTPAEEILTDLRERIAE
ncbi:SCO family protein [uncultured Nisaea sp.]|uniref:SCO family protein n=1 Tax=uncultured Nisaea sp. TaxID=538215 RepID=UPI0030EE5DB1